MKEGFVNIHGKAYETVASRVNRFRTEFKDYTLASKIVTIDDAQCIVEAYILNNEGRLIANGHAQEFRSSSQINKTSYVENCETSAIGRALAAFGIGGTEFASANEVENAIHQQKVTPIKPESAKSVSASVWDELSIDEQNFLTGIAIEIVDALSKEKIREAYGLFYENKLDNDEQTALWSRLDSKQRAAIKSYKDAIAVQA